MTPYSAKDTSQILQNGIAAPSPDFDLETLRLPPDYSSAPAAKKRLTTIPVKKPRKHEWIRTYDNPEFGYSTMLYPDPESSDFYLLHPSLWEEMLGHAHPFLIVPTITRQKTLFFLPLRLLDSDGRTNSWHVSALEAAELATQSWIRLSANREIGGYDVAEAAVALSEPDWRPLEEIGLEGLLQMAFKRRLIDSADHDLLQRLRGEV